MYKCTLYDRSLITPFNIYSAGHVTANSCGCETDYLKDLLNCYMYSTFIFFLKMKPLESTQQLYLPNSENEILK